jgi:hypothetical protein
VGWRNYAATIGDEPWPALDLVQQPIDHPPDGTPTHAIA